MKNAARVFFLVLCIIWLATAGSIPAQADVVSLGILPVQDESGAQVPPELLRNVMAVTESMTCYQEPVAL